MLTDGEKVQRNSDVGRPGGGRKTAVRASVFELSAASPAFTGGLTRWANRRQVSPHTCRQVRERRPQGRRSSSSPQAIRGRDRAAFAVLGLGDGRGRNRTFADRKALWGADCAGRRQPVDRAG